MIEVYHLNDKVFFEGKGEVINRNSIDSRYYDANMGFNRERQTAAVTELFNEGYYNLVAKVHTNSLSRAWERTNHIDDDWQKDVDVEAFSQEARSSKVGDIMKDANGKYHIVATVGFTEIPDGAMQTKTKKIKM
jgi:hypothetical protein